MLNDGLSLATRSKLMRENGAGADCPPSLLFSESHVYQPVVNNSAFTLGGMLKRPKSRRTLEEILQSTSDVLFPEELGEARISLSSRGYDGDSPLHVLLWRGDDYGTKLLIESGADVNVVGDMDQTPLHVALMKENLPIAKLLLQFGARIDVRSKFGQTVPEMAKKLGGKFAELFK